MKIKLLDGILEKSNGEMHWHSKDQPFDVDTRVGQDLIATGDFEEVVKERVVNVEIMEDPPKKKKADKENK